MAAPALVRHVEDAFPELEHLFEAGDRVRELVSHPGWQAVNRLVGLELQAVSARLDNATVPLEQAEYALAHGRRSGLMAYQEAAHAIVQRSEKRHSEQQAKHERGAESPQEG